MKKYLLAMTCAATLGACGGGGSGPTELSAFPASSAQGKVVVQNVSTTDLTVLSFTPILDSGHADYSIRPQPQSIPAGSSATYQVPVGSYTVTGGKGFKWLLGPGTLTVSDGKTVTLTTKK